MSAPPYMPFYPADYLSDTAHLSTLQHGAYCLLIFTYWRNRALPCDDVKLARIARMSMAQWMSVRPTLAEFFTEDWRHHRIELELEKAQAKSVKRSIAGKMGGDAKSLKTKSGTVAIAKQLDTKAVASYNSEPEAEKKETASAVVISEPDESELALEAYNEVACVAGWPRAKMTEPRKASLRKRIRSAGGLPGWVSAMHRARGSPFLCGRNKNGWRANLDFFLQAKSFINLIEGSYDERQATNDFSAAIRELHAEISEREDPQPSTRSDLELFASEHFGMSLPHRSYG